MTSVLSPRGWNQEMTNDWSKQKPSPLYLCCLCWWMGLEWAWNQGNFRGSFMGILEEMFLLDSKKRKGIGRAPLSISPIVCLERMRQPSPLPWRERQELRREAPQRSDNTVLTSPQITSFWVKSGFSQLVNYLWPKASKQKAPVFSTEIISSSVSNRGLPLQTR